MKRLDKEIEARIKNKVKETVDKINEYFNLDMPVPPVYYDVKGTTAGLAKLNSMTIHLNPTLLLQNIEDSIEVTVPHEVCHLTNFYQHRKEGRSGAPEAHGKRWKFMMAVVGACAKNTHAYDVSSVQRKKAEYQYQCGCEGGQVLSQLMHKRVLALKPGYVYLCKKCNSALHSGERIVKIGFSTASPNGTTKVREDTVE